MAVTKEEEDRKGVNQNRIAQTETDELEVILHLSKPVLTQLIIEGEQPTLKTNVGHNVWFTALNIWVMLG